MTRVKRGFTRHRRHKKILSQARGYQASSHRQYKWAREALIHAWSHAYRDRRTRKRDFRSLWILRIGAASRLNGLTYSQFIHGLKLAQVDLDRKVLADLAVRDSGTFAELAALSREHLGAQSSQASG